jgi:hypothetical protein
MQTTLIEKVEQSNDFLIKNNVKTFSIKVIDNEPYIVPNSCKLMDLLESIESLSKQLVLEPDNKDIAKFLFCSMLSCLDSLYKEDDSFTSRMSILLVVLSTTKLAKEFIQ